MRISTWAERLGASVADISMYWAAVTERGTTYAIKDVWTTRDGSWEPSDKLGSAPDWAKDYLTPTGHPNYFDDAGGDHHIFCRVEDVNGNFIPGKGFLFSTGGITLLTKAVAPGAGEILVGEVSKPHSGWANIPITGNYDPEKTPGPWCATTYGAKHAVCGAGLPYNHHISWFYVWKEIEEGGSAETLEKTLQQAAKENQLIRFNRDAALQKEIFDDGMVPNSNEFQVVFDGVTYIGQRAESLVDKIARVYYVKHGDWGNVQSVPAIIEEE